MHQPVPTPTCAKCGAALPTVTQHEFRCQYCGALYRKAQPASHGPPASSEADAQMRMLLELKARLIEASAAQPRRRSSFVGCLFAAVFLAVAAVAAIGILAHLGWGPQALTSLLGDPVASANLRLQGSNTIGADLAPALVEAFFRSRSAADVRRVSKDSSKAVIVSGKLPTENAPTTASIVALGTGTAFTALTQGKCDVAMASRPITPDEQSKLSKTAQEAVIGLDGIAVIVHPSNPVTSLDTEQLGRIFRGEAGDWSQVGTGHGPITVLARDANSGTWDTFRGLVLGATGALVATAQRFDSNEELVGKVLSAPSAIGFAPLAAVRSAKALAVSDKGTVPVTPSLFTVSTETYPLTRRLYLYTVEPTPLADAFVTFAQSPEGQALVATSGYVDLTVRVESATPACANCTPEYRKAIAGAERISVDFRFVSGGTDLDSRALRDLERVASYAREHHAKRVLLLGFADSQGNPEANKTLSYQRAKAVEGALHAMGATGATELTSEGMGDRMPVATNTTEEGRQKNRRVEVWVFPR
jgi:phosphate transport system substrate-binding protein